MNFFQKVHYSPETGVFKWAVSAPGIALGSTAGSLSKYGYWVIKIGRRQYRAHRLAWFVHHGVWPTGEIDHVNGDKLDNRIQNLRDVSRAENSQNQRHSHRDNHSCGLLGVTWNKQHKRWQAKLQANKKRYHVGYFNDPQAAHVAYMKAKAILHIGGCRH